MNSSKPIVRPLAAKSIAARFNARPFVATLCMTGALTGAVMITGCSGGKEQQAAQSQTQEYIERAESYRNQHQYRAAIIEIRNALQKNPQDRIALAKMASIFNELGQGKSANKVMEPLAATANRDEALIIAQAYFLQHKYQSALDYLSANEQRLKLKNDAAAILLNARAALRLGDVEKAQNLLTAITTNNIDADIERARLLMQQQGPAAEQQQIDKLLQQYPDNVDLLSEAAQLAERQGDLSRAEDLLSKALIDIPSSDILLPQKATILQRLVSTLTKLGRSNEALVYAKTLADANPSGALLQDKFKQGMELFQAGKLDEAEPILTEVFNESQNDTVGMLLGMIRYAKKDLNGAANYLGNNIDPEIAPEAAMTTLAATQLQLAQPEKLLALFDTQDRARIKSPELKMLVGIALLQTGSNTEGEKLIQAAQSEQPDNPAMRATLARYYLASRQPEKAIAILEPTLKNRADDNLSRLLITAYTFAKQPDQALATARALASSTPVKAENLWVLGRTALQLQKLDVADTALRNALAQQADFLPAQLDLAQLHLLRKQNDQAEEIYRTALKQRPDLVGALKGLVIAFAQKSAAPEAIESQLLSVSSSANAKAVIAEYYLRQQRLDDAERLLATIPAAEVNGYPQQLKQQITLVRSAMALQAKDYDKARSYVASGLETNPSSPELLILLARLDLQAKNIASAKKIAAQLSQTQPQAPQVMELSGDIAMIEGDKSTAAKHYRSAWNKTANDGIATKLYQSLAADSKATQAFLNDWIQRSPSSTSAYFFSGIAKQQAGDIQGAVADYEAAITRNPDHAQALNNLAWLYGEKHDQRALALAEKASKIQPQDPAILDTYGWLLYGNGQRQTALTTLREAARLAPQSTDIQAHLKAVETGKAP